MRMAMNGKYLIIITFEELDELVGNYLSRVKYVWLLHHFGQRLVEGSFQLEQAHHPLSPVQLRCCCPVHQIPLGLVHFILCKYK